MTITITINTDNEAFKDEYGEPWTEVSRILRELAKNAGLLERVTTKVLDINGNTVGAVTVSGN